MKRNTTRLTQCVILGCLLLFLGPAHSAWSQSSALDDISPNEFRANFLLNLVLKRDWLREMSARELARNGVVIVVIHDEEVRMRLAEKIRELEFKIPVVTFDSLDDLDGRKPHFVYFGQDSTEEELKALDAIPRTMVTTIGEQPDFFRRGGCFRIHPELPPKNRERMMYDRKSYLESGVRFRTDLFRHITPAPEDD